MNRGHFNPIWVPSEFGPSNNLLLKYMVGAPGFEPGTSCAQGIKHAPAKSLRLNATLVKSAASHNSWLWLAVAGFGYLLAGSLQKSLHEYVHLKRTSELYSVLK